jgi:two-component system phosphate regulon response regulator PhoB
MAMSPRITVVEDEEALSVLLRYNLEAEGYEVETVLRGDEAEIALQERVPDLLILDWMLPGISGIELCRRLRARPETERLPIIMLTARGEESERVRGLATGADDYRRQAVLDARTAGPGQGDAAPRPPGSHFQPAQGRRYRTRPRNPPGQRRGRDIKLGPTEFRLLEFLMSSPGRVYSRAQLLDGVWGHDVYVDERTVDVHVGRLRKAVNLSGMRDTIRTVRGAGYSIEG